MGRLPSSLLLGLLALLALAPVGLLVTLEEAPPEAPPGLAEREGRAGAALAIVVPGGGLTLEGLPAPWVRPRLSEAARLYAERQASHEPAVVVTLSAGTPHKPMPVNARSGFQVYEAEASARLLIRELGVRPEDVFEEDWSLDTVGNAYMLRAMHTEVAGWRDICVVTNEFHMPRTRAIFEKVFALAPVPALGHYNLTFVEVPNDGVPADALAARKARESQSLAGFWNNTARMQSMRDIHRFLFQKHMAYASSRLLKDREPVDPSALSTY